MQSIESIVNHISDLLQQGKSYEGFQQLESIQFRCMRRFGLEKTLNLLTEAFKLFLKLSDVYINL